MVEVEVSKVVCTCEFVTTECPYNEMGICKLRLENEEKKHKE